jgi:hypoxanthine phosphoribosyltransferase
MSTKPGTREDARLTLLFSQATIAARVRELGGQISRDYMGHEILLVGVLKGAFVFLADLMRTLEVPAQVEFVRLASYGTGTTSGGRVHLTLDLEGSMAGRHVLVVEDVLDSGLTLSVLLQQLRAREPASLQLCVLLNKRIRRRYEITPDYVGFDVPDGLWWATASTMRSVTATWRPFTPSPLQRLVHHSHKPG